MSATAQAILDQAARNIQAIVPGLQKFWRGGPDETVDNGIDDFPTLAKLIADGQTLIEAAAIAIRPVPNVAAGVAATAGSGYASRYFTVPSADANGYLDLYRNDAGSGVLVSTYPSSAVMAAAINAGITATTQAGIASAQAAISTTNRAATAADALTTAGNAATATAAAGSAQDKLTLATAQAGIATDKAAQVAANLTVATTQAGIATAKADEANAHLSGIIEQAAVVAGKTEQVAEQLDLSIEQTAIATAQQEMATLQAGIAVSASEAADAFAGSATSDAAIARSEREAAEEARTNAVAAASSAGKVEFCRTKAEADLLFPTLKPGTRVEVEHDESLPDPDTGHRTRYEVTQCCLVFTLDLDIFDPTKVFNILNYVRFLPKADNSADFSSTLTALATYTRDYRLQPGSTYIVEIQPVSYAYDATFVDPTDNHFAQRMFRAVRIGAGNWHLYGYGATIKAKLPAGFVVASDMRFTMFSTDIGPDITLGNMTIEGVTFDFDTDLYTATRLIYAMTIGGFRGLKFVNCNFIASRNNQGLALNLMNGQALEMEGNLFANIRGGTQFFYLSDFSVKKTKATALREGLFDIEVVSRRGVFDDTVCWDFLSTGDGQVYDFANCQDIEIGKTTVRNVGRILGAYPKSHGWFNWKEATPGAGDGYFLNRLLGNNPPNGALPVARVHCNGVVGSGAGLDNGKRSFLIGGNRVSAEHVGVKQPVPDAVTVENVDLQGCGCFQVTECSNLRLRKIRLVDVTDKPDSTDAAAFSINQATDRTVYNGSTAFAESILTGSMEDCEAVNAQQHALVIDTPSDFAVRRFKASNYNIVGSDSYRQGALVRGLGAKPNTRFEVDALSLKGGHAGTTLPIIDLEYFAATGTIYPMQFIDRDGHNFGSGGTTLRYKDDFGTGTPRILNPLPKPRYKGTIASVVVSPTFDQVLIAADDDDSQVVIGAWLTNLTAIVAGSTSATFQLRRRRGASVVSIGVAVALGNANLAAMQRTYLNIGMDAVGPLDIQPGDTVELHGDQVGTGTGATFSNLRFAVCTSLFSTLPI